MTTATATETPGKTATVLSKRNAPTLQVIQKLLLDLERVMWPHGASSMGKEEREEEYGDEKEQNDDNGWGNLAPAARP